MTPTFEEIKAARDAEEKHAKIKWHIKKDWAWLYFSGFTINEISTVFSCNELTVWKYFKKRGIKLRSSSQGSEILRRKGKNHGCCIKLGTGKGFRVKNGYLLSTEKGTKGVGLHRIVMEKHVGRKLKSDEFIHHVDSNKQNNSISNLKIMSNSEHMALHNKQNSGKRDFTNHLRGENHYCSKLTTEDVLNIRANKTSTMSSLGEKYNVSWQSIQSIKNRKTWKHI